MKRYSMRQTQASERSTRHGRTTLPSWVTTSVVNVLVVVDWPCEGQGVLCGVQASRNDDLGMEGTCFHTSVRSERVRCKAGMI